MATDKTMKLVLLAAVSCIVSVNAHGSMIMPLARNSIDAETSAWSNGKHPMTGTIEPYNCRCLSLCVHIQIMCATDLTCVNNLGQILPRVLFIL